MSEYFIGLMSGTSMDAVDAVLVQFQRDRPNLIATHTHPFDPKFRRRLAALCQPGKNEIARFGALDVELGTVFAAAAQRLLAESAVPATQVRAIGSHGQTIRHQPDETPAYTLQIGDPSTIAEETGIATIADFRRRDVAAGGQGAPLTPAFHAAVFRSSRHHRVVVNIGGIANVTLLPADPAQPTTGFDTGPGNAIMDAWAGRHHRGTMDKGGSWAAAGSVDAKLLERMLNDPYFSRLPPKSTGREYFGLQWLDRNLKKHRKRMLRKNVQATLCELTAASIAQAVERYAPDAQEVIACGGGTHNLALMFRLQALLGARQMCSSEDYGIDPDWVEAMAFAWLAKRTLDGHPGNLPAVTGARHTVILGGIYPGRSAS